MFINYAKKLGHRRPLPSTPAAWDKNASSYDAVATKIKQSGADAVFLGGIICNNGGKLIKDLRAGLGSNVTLFAPDGFTPIDAATIKTGRPGIRGHVHHAAGNPVRPADRRREDFRGGLHEGERQGAGSVHELRGAGDGRPADRDRRREGHRADVAQHLFGQDVKDGILGNFKIDENGDTTLGTVSVWQVKGQKGVFLKTITPELSFVKG